MSEDTGNSGKKKTGLKLDPKELKQLESRFRHHRRAQRSRRGDDAEGRRRVFVRVAFLIGATAIVLAMVLYPRFRPAPPPPPPSGQGPIAEFLGARAVVPKGCREVRDSRFAALDGLAPGSSTARDMQKGLIARENLPLEIENSIGMRFRLIPKLGTYMMGSPLDEPDRGPDEQQHVAEIKEDFYIGMYEVTQAQFEKVMGFNPSGVKGENRPVEEVTWYNAAKFCENLCKLEDLPDETYCLPTEEEWEYVCRANTQTPYYCGSDLRQLQDFAVFAAARGETVGSRRPNAWGVHNLHGNVWEWCANFIYDYQTKAKVEFDDVHVGIYYKHAIRGGNFFVDAAQCRSAARHCLTGTSRGNMLGFRVLRRISPQTAARNREPLPEVTPPETTPAPETGTPEAVPETAPGE